MYESIYIMSSYLWVENIILLDAEVHFLPRLALWSVVGCFVASTEAVWDIHGAKLDES